MKLAYKDERSIEWMEVLAGEKAYKQVGEWLPQSTMDVFREYLIGIKGPLTTPVGGGIRSLNVALRQTLDRGIAPDIGLVCLSASCKMV